MISPALRAQILRLYRVESWKPYVIAKHLGVHPLTVSRVLVSDGLPAPVVTRPSKLDPFIPYLRQMLDRYPGLTAARLLQKVRERVGDAIRFHPTLWDFSAHYGFEPRPVGVAKGNEKGRVERAIRYLRTSFFPARTYTDLADLNSQALTFCQTIAAQRRHTEDHSLSVREVWERERPLLLPLPSAAFPTDERIEVRAGKTPYVRFDKNDYSIPHTAVRRTLTVLACDETVRIVDGSSLLAEHPRCFDQGQTIEQESHIEALRKEKRQSREPLSLRRLTLAAPAAHAFLQRLGEHGGFLGPAIARLERLLDLFGPLELQYALTQAQAHPVPDIHALQLILDARQHQLSLPPPIGSGLPPDSPLRAVTVTPHPLSSYDSLLTEDSHEPRK